MSDKKDDTIINLPVIPLRGLVVFPGSTITFDVGRKKSIEALKRAMNTDQKVFIVCQKDPVVDEPGFDDLYEIGTVCTVKQLIRLNNNERCVRVAVEGVFRAELLSLNQIKPYLLADVCGIDDTVEEENREDLAYKRLVRKEFDKYSDLTKEISNEVHNRVDNAKLSGELADIISSEINLTYINKQIILSEINPTERIAQLYIFISKENEELEIEKEIQNKVAAEIEKGQREYYLREEMKVIAETLGETESPIEEADEYRQKINSLKCSDEIKDKLRSYSDKLMKMPLGSHEATVLRNYLDKALEIPFGKYTKDSINLDKARKILDKEHYGLSKVKERIVDSLAVYKRNPDFCGQILCLAGPPGVGKTSVVKSLAKSMNREYVRIALGGIHDEAEIRGHRKTYIGAMPGRIVEAVIKSGVMNPIILLDEIDKLGSDYKGDPSSALLEALDPEQNSTFADHYIEFPLDLSKVLFITTANDISAIPAPLYDRMEVIELSSYTVEEKFNIAKKHLIKKELARHNISSKELKITDDAMYTVIEGYTKEAGVRNLQKQLATICRKAAVALEDGESSLRINNKNIESVLGKIKYKPDSISKDNQVGVVNGLAWTSVGGTMLPIEVSALDGTGKIELTGNLGDVMKESAKTAVSFVRSRADFYGIDNEFYKNKDIHIHTPEGAVPKDGPSAGLAFTTALVSELTGIPVKSDVAMTGEISLKGKAMAIGGLKEKSMAAYKAGCTTVIIPNDNLKDLSEISEEVKTSVEFVAVDSFEEVLNIAFEDSVIKSKQKSKMYYTSESKAKNSAVTQ